MNDARICVLGGHCSGQGRSCGVMRPPGLRRRRALLRIRSQEGGQEHQQPTVVGFVVCMFIGLWIIEVLGVRKLGGKPIEGGSCVRGVDVKDCGNGEGLSCDWGG